MRIGLWSDCHNFPSLPIMKLSAYHKALGDNVSPYIPLDKYDIVYASKVFSFTPDIDAEYEVCADELRKGGTGYCISVNDDGKECFDSCKNISLPDEIEHIYPDYSLYPRFNFAAGFLTRGCPRNCGFCIVGKKEGCQSQQVAELSEFWHEQKMIKILDPNILACKNHEKLLQDLAESKAQIDFTQGLDIRLINPDNIKLLNNIKAKILHFAWDDPHHDLTDNFKRFAELTNIKSERNRIVYVLTNFNSTLSDDLYRVYTLRDLGFSPYVMIYRKETAPREIRRLQRWCNCRWIFHSCSDFKDYKG
ncbi:MAG: radical SAM protein [Oscillospiraceae bacterium]